MRLFRYFGIAISAEFIPQGGASMAIPGGDDESKLSTL